MKINNKLLILTVVLLAMISLGAVSAADDVDGLDDTSDALSVSQDDQSISDNSQTYDKTIYVAPQGNDSGSGSEGSPYASINKAISQVNASDNAVINLKEGIYTGDNNIDLSINLAHKNYNGSLTFIGAGKDKTIIDANKEGQIFKLISADSIVIFKDIGFINAKAPNYGSAIISEGDLTIDNCLFANNTANSYATVYQDDPNNFKVINSVFRDNVAGSGNVNIYYSVYQDTDYVVEIINNTFINATTSYSWADSSCVYVQATHVLVQGNTFINISGTGKGSLYVRADDCNVTDNVFKDCSYDGTNDGAILYIGDAYIQGNTFENWTSTKGAAVYALLNFNAYLAYEDKLVDGATFKLTCNVTDDMGNPVNTYGDVFFYLNDENLGHTKANNGVATLTVNKLLDNGVYDLTGTYGYVSFNEVDNPFECTVKNATVTVDFDHNPIDVWVAADGNDTTGNGSENNPFQTIKNAIDYAIDEDSVEFTIHLKDGLYNITGDYGLSYSDVVRMSIVGENYGKAIISANNAGSTFLTSGVYTEVTLKNLTFVNSTATRAFNVRYLTMEGCIVDNVGQLYAQTSPSRVVLRNVTWSHSRNFMIYNGEIYDSRFENITTSGTGVFWLSTVSSDDMIIIMNSKFINIENTGSSGAVAYVQGDLLSINNTYASNNASGGDYGVLYVNANYAVSINDTFIDNSAAENYGAAYFLGRNQDSFIAIANAKFINNTAGKNGGALGTYGAVLVNCTFENNTAGENGGAIYTLTFQTSYSYLDNLTLTDVTFKNNDAGANGKDIFITSPTSASYSNTNLAGMTVSFNDLSTTTLQDFVSANVTHTSGAIIGGGKVTFYLNGSYMGVADVIDGVATLDYLGFKRNGTFVLSGVYNIATDDTVYNNATVVVALAPLKDNVTLYVSDSKGNDTTGDGSLNNPYKTINAALTSGYKQSAVIVVRVLEGNYSGEFNNNLTVASSLDISIIGDGQDRTIIDGQDVSWFLNILAGDSMIKVANMTVANVTKNYVDAKLYNQHPAISIEKGATVIIDNVGFIRCHGTEGGAIYTEGTLSVLNSYFFNNGDSNYGAAIKNYGTLIVSKTEFVANHAKYYSTIYNEGNFILVNSVIQDSMRVNGWTGNAMVMGGPGNITIYNSTIFRSGKTCAELIGAGQTWANNPGFAISIGSTGNVKVVDSVIDGNDKAYSASYISNVAFGGSGSIGVFVPYGLEVVNTKILNLRDIISNSKGTNLIDGCYIENVTYVSEGTSYDFNLTVVNSYFADGTTMVTKRATANVILDNNWWGTNDQPTYKVSNVNTNPNTWLVLTLNSTDEPGLLQDVTLAFKVTDGESITDYDGKLYAREFNMSAVNGTLDVTNGTIDNNVVSKFKGIDGAPYYVEATVDGQTVNLTNEKVEIGQSEILAFDVELMVGENLFDVLVLVDNASTSNFNINLTVNKKTYTVPVVDGIAVFEIEELPYGNYTLDYAIEDNDVCYGSTASANLTVLRYEPVISMVSNVTDEVIIIFTDDDGIPMANASLSYSVDGVAANGTTDENGQIVISGVKGVVEIIASYDGDEIYAPITVDKNVTVYNGRKQTQIMVVVVDGNFNIDGLLTDEDGNLIANATIEYTVGHVAANVTTDDYGAFSILGDNDEIEFHFDETFDYEASAAFLSLIDIAPVRQATEIEIALGDIKIYEDVNVNITVSNVTGEVKVYVDDEDAIAVNVTDGKGNFTITAVPAGDHSIVVVYLGDLYHEASVASQDFTVDKLASEVKINGTNVFVDQKSTITVTIPENATGLVIVSVDDETEYVIEFTHVNVISVDIALGEAGNHTVSAVYLGDAVFDMSYSDEITVVVSEKEVSQGNVTVSSDVKAGEEANVTVSIPGATGNVSIFVDGVEKVVPLDENGTAQYTIPSAEAGDHSVVVIYPGDDTHAPAMGIESFTVAKKDSEANITTPVDFKIGEEANVTVSIPNATGNVSVIVDGIETVVPLDENGTAVVPFNVTGGEHSVVVVYSGDDTHAPVVKTATFYAEELGSEFTNLTVSDDLVVTGVLVNTLGNPIANATIAYVVGSNSGNLTTGEDGSFTIAGESNAVLSVNYAGNDYIVGSNFAIKFGNLESARLASEFNVTEGISIKTYAVDSKAGEVGQTTSFRLTDSNGNPIVNATVKFAYKTVILNRTTDENGIVFIGINTQIAQEALCALSYLGDEKHNATFVAFSFDIQKKPITISASAKSYNANAKTKKYTVTLKTEKCNSRDGKVYLSAGKKVTLKLNGKTYTAKTNSKGQATFSLKITKKGKQTAKISFAGDKTYASASKSVKITIK